MSSHTVFLLLFTFYCIYFVARLFNRNLPAYYILLRVVPFICKNRPSLTYFMLSTFSYTFSNFYMFSAFTFSSSDFYKALPTSCCWNLPDKILYIYFTFNLSMPFKKLLYFFQMACSFLYLKTWSFEYLCLWNLPLFIFIIIPNVFCFFCFVFLLLSSNYSFLFF